jgi:sigma-B regulation protein RsbU (phosphoserine phosphatase)
VTGRDPKPEDKSIANRSAEPPGRFLRSAGVRGVPWRLLSRISPARRIALVAVAVFDVSEIVLLSVKGFEHHNWVALILGFALLLLLTGFELAEHAAMKRDHELSREISEWLIPHTPPSMRGLEIAFTTRMANHVGSDYFNVFPRWAVDRTAESHRAFIVVADVAGIGMQGALLMATFQASLRALADSRMPLGDLASQMNQWCCDRSLEGRHFTMAFLADLDPETGSLHYVSAGHQPAVLSRAGGDMERLEVSGFPFGVRPDSPYEIGTSLVGPEDTLVVFTDGVVKAENRGQEQFGAERVIQTLRRARGFTANETLTQLSNSILSFCGAVRQPDDLSFVVVRRRPVSGAAF